jgi:hypothetical protein
MRVHVSFTGDALFACRKPVEASTVWRVGTQLGMTKSSDDAAQLMALHSRLTFTKPLAVGSDALSPVVKDMPSVRVLLTDPAATTVAAAAAAPTEGAPNEACRSAPIFSPRDDLTASSLSKPRSIGKKGNAGRSSHRTFFLFNPV